MGKVNRPTEQLDLQCLICSAPVKIFKIESPHPESPTMFRSANAACWFGTVWDGKGGARLLACCSEPCTQKLLNE